MRMKSRGDFSLLLLWLQYITTFNLIFGVCRGELSETNSLINFFQTIDPKNLLKIGWNGSMPDRCSGQWIGIECNLETDTLTEIRLENLNLGGIIDADSLCRLPSLRVLNLAKNHIVGSIPDSISNCISMTHLNLSSNFLRGRIPSSLNNLKNLKSLDISNNSLSGPVPNFTHELELMYSYTMVSSVEKSRSKYVSHMGNKRINETGNITNNSTGFQSETPSNSTNETDKSHETEMGLGWVFNYAFLIMVIACFALLIFISNKKEPKVAQDDQECLRESPIKIMTVEEKEDTKPGEENSELVFFSDECERFKIDDLFGSAADLQGQSLWSSLYKVTLKNNTIFAVKRLKKLQVSIEEFRRTMSRVGSLRHPNLLPLVAYHSSNEEKLLIYRYQRNRSLLYLLENYADGKRNFPWTHRLSIANGIARGLDYIYKEEREESFPHGNLKLSNILLGENEEPLISEYGFQKFLDPKRALLYSSNGYIAPEKRLTEKADVFSFGVILLELLTGKTIEKSGLDLIKWVKAMVSEEWTGEVFDKEVYKAGKQGAFPLLNISLKCVSQLPENRPNMAEVLEKIEEVTNAQDDFSFSSTSSVESNQQYGCLLHMVIPEGWETPGSNQ
ncbi:putative inactive receptor-like protein kinase At1g64210 [Tasmannia lanceolata]|uniref:putative inactive receptor-like protein kinase At1g64210 n=1 Tax=Tasmannia lanceolata TaxID=3420 RepID=UPI004063E136